MNRRIIETIALKDLREVAQNKGAWMPMVLIPLIFIVVLPLLIILGPGLAGIPMEHLFGANSPLALMLQSTPGLRDEMSGMSQVQIWIVLMTGYFLAPFFLIIPLMFSTIVGAESFVGEKERKTLEALLYTPATDGELFVGKVAASVLPAVALGWFTFLIYAIVVNAAGLSIMGRIWFPPLNWWPLMILVTPAIATLGMAVIVLISARVGTFMEAYQMSGSLVVIVLALIAGQVTGLLYLSVWTSVLVGAVLLALDLVLIKLGIRNFQRGNLLARL